MIVLKQYIVIDSRIYLIIQAVIDSLSFSALTFNFRSRSILTDKMLHLPPSGGSLIIHCHIYICQVPLSQSLRWWMVGGGRVPSTGTRAGSPATSSKNLEFSILVSGHGDNAGVSIVFFNAEL